MLLVSVITDTIEFFLIILIGYNQQEIEQKKKKRPARGWLAGRKWPTL